MRLTRILSGAVALVACLAVAAGAVAASTATTPAASTMALVTTDFPAGAIVSSQGSGGSAPVPAASLYHRNFTGAKVGTVRTFTFANVVDVAKSQAAAESYVAGIRAAAQSPKLRKSLLNSISTSFTPKKSKKKAKARFVRFGKLNVGDSAMNVVIQVNSSVGKILIGEIFVQEGTVLAVINYGVLGPAVTKVAADVKLAKAQVAHIDAASTAPVATAVPTITGTVAQGQTLTASTGVWTGSPTGYTYQWEHCDANGANCVAIANATGTTYAVTAVDVNYTLVVVVTATNPTGTATSSSAHTTTVV